MALLSTCLLSAALLAGEPLGWISAPTPVPGAPAARNPALASGGGVVHAVFRVRSGGLGSMTTSAGGDFTKTALLPGSMPAASQNNKNYPALAAGPAGSGHVVWGPPSAPGNGAYYQRIGPDGVPVAGVTKLSDRWIESISAVVADDELHVLLTAIKKEGEPDGNDGVFHVHASLANGPFITDEAWQFPNFIEHAAAPAPGGGLALVGRWDVIKRIDLVGGTWSGFANVTIPPGTTSVGRPRLEFAGDTPLWALIGWVDTTPSTIEVRTGGPKAPWTTLPDGDLFDPVSADGEPAVALVAGPAGERLVAWLAAGGPRLRVSFGVDEWGPAIAMPGTEDATSFALIRDGEHYLVVLADSDGTLLSGRLGLPAAPDGTTGDDSTTGDLTTGAPDDPTTGGATTTGEPDPTTGDVAPTTDDATSDEATTDDAATGTTDAALTGSEASTADEELPPTTVGFPSRDGDEGCACNGGPGGSPWVLVTLGLAWRRRTSRKKSS
jgi:MYXO-CTERM domain-containing protein